MHPAQPRKRARLQSGGAALLQQPTLSWRLAGPGSVAAECAGAVGAGMAGGLGQEPGYAWAPSRPLQGLWQRLRLAMLTGLLGAHRTAQPAAQQSPRGLSLLAHMRAALQQVWLLGGEAAQGRGLMLSVEVG